MDHWHPIAVHADEPDAVYRWAHLEGKSPTMRDELYQIFARPIAQKRERIANAGIYAELAVIALKAWWHIHQS